MGEVEGWGRGGGRRGGGGKEKGSILRITKIALHEIRELWWAKLHDYGLTLEGDIRGLKWPRRFENPLDPF